MMRSQIGFWPTGRTVFKVAVKLLVWIIGLLILFVFAIAGWFWYWEHRYQVLTQSYEVPSFYLNMLGAIEGKRPLGALMNDNENTLCVISSYSLWGVEKIDQLTQEQKSSAPKSILPLVDSDSRGSYWIFFTEKAASRIYLVDNSDLGISPKSTTGSDCVDRGTYFETSRKVPDAPHLKGIVITFSKGE